jgi:hypothetical protein
MSKYLQQVPLEEIAFHAENTEKGTTNENNQNNNFYSKCAMNYCANQKRKEKSWQIMY